MSRVKKIILAYDMDAAENFWEKKFGNPHKRSVRVRVPIQSTTGGTFSLAEYGEVSRASTKWMQQRSEGALRYMRAVQERATTSKTVAHNTGQKNKKKKGDRVELTWKSYVLQEAESIRTH